MPNHSRDPIEAEAEAVIEEIERFLALDESRFSFSELDGAITAIVSGPEVVKPSEWLPFVFGDDGGGFATTEEAEALLATVMTWYNHRAVGLFNGHDYVPVLEETRQGRRWVDDPTMWCSGYLAGLDLHAAAWQPLFDGDDQELIVPILAFGADAGDETELAEALAEVRATIPNDECETVLGDAATRIYAYWLKRRTAPPKPATTRRKRTT